MSTEPIPFEHVGQNEVLAEVQPPSGLQHTLKLGELVKALASARKAFKKVVKDSSNPFFKSKYADLATVIEAVTPALCDNGLIILQSCRVEGQNAVITTKLCHSSGQWLQDELALPMAKYDAQGAGSAFTYARRYSLSAFLNVAADTDDDGIAAGMGSDRKYETEFDQRTESQRLVAAHQVNAWKSAKAIRTPSQITAYLKNLGITTIEEMPRDKFNDAIKWLLNPKAEADLTETLKDSVAAVKNPCSGLFAAAAKKEVPESDVKQWCYETFKVDSMTKLTPLQISDAMKWIQTLV